MYLHHSGQRGRSQEQEKLSWPEGKDNQETPSRTSHFPGELGEEPVVLGQVIESGWWRGEPTASLFKKKKTFYFILVNADSQCCNSFRWTAKGLRHTYTCPLLL